MSKISWFALLFVLLISNIGRVETNHGVNIFPEKPFTFYDNFDVTACSHVVTDQEKKEKQNPFEKIEENREKEEDLGKHLTKKSSASNQGFLLSHDDLITLCQYRQELKKQVLDLAEANRKKTPLTLLFLTWKIDC